MGSDEENNDQLLEQIRQLKEEVASLKEIRELKEQIARIHEQTTGIHEQTTSLHERIPHNIFETINTHKDGLLPSAVKPQDTNTQCNCRCRYLVRGGTVVGNGVSLGMVWAVDVGNLSPERLVVLDNGLRDLARQLVPPKTGSPSGTSAKIYQELLTLFGKVPLRQGFWPSDSKVAFTNYRDPTRNRHQRLVDGLVGEFSDPTRLGLLGYQTLFQLLAFRGINLDAAGN